MWTTNSTAIPKCSYWADCAGLLNSVAAVTGRWRPFFDTIKRAAGNQHVAYGNDVEGTLLEHDKHVVAGAPMNCNPWCPMNIALQPVCVARRDLDIL